MNQIRLDKAPRIGAVVLMLAGAVATTGCGKSSSVVNSATKTVTVTATGPASSGPLTHAQAVAAGDKICASMARRADQAIAIINSTRQANRRTSNINTGTGGAREAFAGGKRVDSRELEELHVPASERRALLNFTSTMLELSIIEEQLVRPLLDNDRRRIGLIAPEVRSLRVHALNQSKEFGFKVCAMTAESPVE
jgi:hypothetical protein